jgi:predicted small metal-binding protein
MSKQLACGDIVPGCDFKAEAASEAELIKKVAEHAAKHHGVKDVTPELQGKLQSAVRTR